MEREKVSKMKNMIGNTVLVRGDRSGLYVGVLSKVSKSGKKVKLQEARMIYEWVGAATPLQIAKDGVSEESKITVAVNEIVLTDAVSIIPMTRKAIDNIRSIKEWKS